MYKTGDYIIYRKDVCKITEIKEKLYHNQDYYKLTPINDTSLKLVIPINNKFIRPLINQAKIDSIIANIPNIKALETNDKYIEQEYKRLMSSGSHEDLIKIIKTTYLRNKERLDNNKKTTDKDNNYFKQAEKYLYTEFSVVMNISYEEAKEYVISKVKEISK